MRSIELLVVHCSATRAHQDIGRKEINSWHEARGWGSVGYHFVIRRNGVVEPGRPVDKAGVHTKGHNAKSIGICLVGGVDANGKAENNFTKEQFKSLQKLLLDLLESFPSAVILGHRDLSPDLDGDGVIEPFEFVKDCPCFDVRDWWNHV